MPLPVLSVAELRRLGELVRAPRKGLSDSLQRRSAPFTPRIHVVWIATAIPAGESDECELREFTADDELEAVLDSADEPLTVEVWNLSEAEVPAETHALAVQEIGSGRLILATGGGEASTITTLQFVPWGFPTAGEVEITLWLPDPDGADVVTDGDDTLTLDWDADLDDFETALLAHDRISSNATLFSADGGPWPYAAFNVRFLGGFVGKRSMYATADVSGLTGGAFPIVHILKFTGPA